MEQLLGAAAQQNGLPALPPPGHLGRGVASGLAVQRRVVALQHVQVCRGVVRDDVRWHWNKIGN